MKIDHIGIAVKSIAEAVQVYEQALGLTVAGYDQVDEQGVRLAMLKIGESYIELLESIQQDSTSGHEFFDRGILLDGFKQFNIAFSDFKHREAHALLIHLVVAGDCQAQSLFIDLYGFCNRLYRYSNVIDFHQPFAPRIGILGPSECRAFYN